MQLAPVHPGPKSNFLPFRFGGGFDDFEAIGAQLKLSWMVRQRDFESCVERRLIGRSLTQS
jgi:hypothetical protein